ncbi:ElyC/SanA/YdcF family protein [Enteractinococcus coprophilus]|uniref:DUF218 domain-containing protein n=1 Tax=Enteractinococcus coprophilus TaxID=1027633 RepID=A0A543AGH4_9MICC|nr:ElyC/SanA/YdcF family protein [Enteractinococcus coprophilus]TQL71684.1 DUF218 domain-containing protein [Enteractinococcus coprophilus]
MRKLKMISGIMATLVIGWLLFVTLNVIYPPQGDLESPRDAVVSLSPQDYRLPLAEEVFANTGTNTLVISYVEPRPGRLGDYAPQLPEAVIEYCDTDTPEDVVCLAPVEISTIGEAFAVNDLVNEQSWDSITVVTSKWHTFRTRFIFNQCIDDDVDVNFVYPETDMTTKQWAAYLAYENAAIFKALYEGLFRC